MIIRALSFDFDGCLFHKNYCLSDDKNVIKHNEAFFVKVQAETKILAAEKVITFVGSNRQSFNIDSNQHIMNETESCFPAIQKISTKLGATLDPFLLADVYGELEAGTSFKLATATPTTCLGHADCLLLDETKMTIIYAQMHRIATQHSEDKIFFDFFDDRNDILSALKRFFNTYPELIPHNVILRLHKYEGMEVALCLELQGTGIIDTNYCTTVRELGKNAVHHYRLNATETEVQIRMHEFVTPEKMTHRKDLTVESLQFIHASAQDTVATAIQDSLHIASKKDLMTNDSLAQADSKTPSSNVNISATSNTFFQLSAVPLRNKTKKNGSQSQQPAYENKMKTVSP